MMDSLVICGRRQHPRRRQQRSDGSSRNSDSGGSSCDSGSGSGAVAARLEQLQFLKRLLG